METDIKLCECGCGSPAPIATMTCKRMGRVKGRPVRFVSGHNKGNVRHGRSGTPEWRAFFNALSRCTNPNMTHYADYGGRGICFLLISVEALIAEISLRPSLQHSLDRINNDGHYEHGNIRWATKKEQRTNQRRK